ncbi:hypothetical protein RRG08_031027 [Elysia crispata]|uniref:Uncharacterized protein n=1 Tax=Elysia crispata TaxID=231223 RepID=A0AAE0ZEZ8_9GAST|nr:hypothetical protein RRG08_031027 [Elysia crispata]
MGLKRCGPKFTTGGGKCSTLKALALGGKCSTLKALALGGKCSTLKELALGGKFSTLETPAFFSEILDKPGKASASWERRDDKHKVFHSFNLFTPHSVGLAAFRELFSYTQCSRRQSARLKRKC